MRNEVLRLHKISNGLKVLLLASVLLAGCGESDASAGEGRASAKSRLEFDITAKPGWLKIVSRNDGQVKIDDILVNRGNCKLNMQGGYRSAQDPLNLPSESRMLLGGDIMNSINVITGGLYNTALGAAGVSANIQKYEMNPSRARFFFEKRPELKGNSLPTKDNQLVNLRETLKFNNPKDVEYYNNLTQEAQAIYDNEDDRMALGFGEEATFPIGCSYDSVLEVTIKTDKGEVSYQMGRK